MQSTWLHVHVTLAMLAYAACALSFAIAMMFLGSGHVWVGELEAAKPLLDESVALARQANDLSRGCKAEDIVDAVAITAVQAQARKSSS